MAAEVPGLRVAGGLFSSGGTFYCGGYDPTMDTLYLGPGGHPDGMAEAGVRPVQGVTPGVTVFASGDSVLWANDSRSLPDPGLTTTQADLIQRRLGLYFQGRTVRRVDALD